MAKASDLLGTFSQARDDQRRRVSWGAAVSRVATVLMVVAIVAIGAVALRQLWIEWQTAAAQGQSLWLEGLMSAMLVVLFISNIQSRTSGTAETGSLRQRVQVVRQALLAGDTELAPLAAPQPEPLADVPPHGESVRIERLRPLTDTQATLLDLCGATALPLGLVAAFLAIVLVGVDVTQPRAPNNPPPWLDGSMSVLAAVLLAIGVTWAVRRVREWRPQPAILDDVGIRWARRTRQPHVRWGDARAFYTVSTLGGTGEMFGWHIIYVLDSGEQVFSWQRAGSRFDRTRAASDQLARLIVGRSGLPLRDLSLAFKGATEPRPPGTPETANATRTRMLARIEAQARERQLDPRTEARLTALVGRLTPPDTAGAESVSAAVRRALEGVGLPAAPPKGTTGRGCALLLASVVVFALLAGASWGLQQAQGRYLACLPAQIHAEAPLYADSLAAPDGNWQVSGATANGARYQGHAYHLTGTAGNTVTAWTPTSYGDVAVQVTARQLGSTPSDGIGLIVRADAAGDDYIAFVTSPTDGGWTLWQYHPVDANADDDWHYLGGGSSAAIHKGPGAANTLLAITRGQSYVLFVNGSFAGAATDGDPDVYGSAPQIGTMTTAHQGYAGVYLADGATTGVFSDFAVYRVQPPTSLWYV